MKKLLILLPVIIAMASCTKDSITEKNEEIPTIKFESNSSSTSNVAECGTCPGHIKIGYPISIPEGPSYCITSTSSICGIGGPVYKSTNTTQTEGFIGSFQNVNGKLQMTVYKTSLSNVNRNQYFGNNVFIFDKPEYMNDLVIKELNLSAPYLIKPGTYPIVTENDETFTVIF